jgi:hypothetical protein
VTHASNSVATVETAPQVLAGLAARLTDPGDREAYAALISYFNSLPPGDELSRLAQLLGFLSLLGQRLPDALATFLEALRAQTKTAAEYHQRIEERLVNLPKDIAEGVNPDAVAKAMSESFRQQLTTSGLEDTARGLQASITRLNTLSGQLADSFLPVADKYTTVGLQISADLTKLTNAATQLRQQNADFAAARAEEHWLWKTAACLVILCVGFALGLAFEKRSTAETLVNLTSQLDRIEQALVTSGTPRHARNQRQ